MTGNLTCNQNGEHLLAGLGIRPVTLSKKGETIYGHKHNQDHVTVVARGSITVKLWCECNPAAVENRSYKAGQFFNVPANFFHEITAGEDRTIYLCVFSSPDSKSLEDATWDMAEARG